jgi:drug/metabolite transporter (DMT)-like permease
MNPILALSIANVIWGAASPIFKYALQNIPPFTLAFIRFFFAGLIFLPLAVFKWQKMSRSDFLRILLIGFFGVTINITFFFLGLPKTTSINAPIIASSGPIFIYLFSILFLKEKPKLKVFLGMLTALTGVLVIILSPIFIDNKKLIIGEIEGNLFFLLATFGAVLQTVISRSVMKKINPYQVSFISFIFGGLTFFPLMLQELERWSFGQLTVNGWVGIIFGVLFSSALAYFLFYYGLSKIQAQEAGLFTYIDPVAAILIAIPLLKEYPNLYFFAGAFLVFGGIFLAEGRIHWHPLHKFKNIKD